MNTFDICQHIPSGRYYFVRYVRPDYSLGDGYESNPGESNYWLWSVMPDKIGGVYGGKSMKHICSRWFSLKYMYYFIKVLFS